MTVKAGAPKPDISSGEAAKNALLASKSVAYSTGLRGVYIQHLFEGRASVVSKTRRGSRIVNDAARRRPRNQLLDDTDPERSRPVGCHADQSGDAARAMNAAPLIAGRIEPDEHITAEVCGGDPKSAKGDRSVP